MRIRRSWPLIALGAILLLAGVLGFAALEREGYANPYYAAAVRAMLSGWHNFFFAAYDPGGFVSVDKPPLGLWVQAASAAILGYRGWTLLLPQVLAHIASVALLYHLVARRFGPPAGLIAAVVLALTPISVATARNNTMDSVLVLALLLAAWAVSVTAERDRLAWLVAAMALVGIGFNIKMLQAYLVLPAVGLVYLVGAPLAWSRRVWHLGAATGVLLAVSLAWAVAVDLTPADQRPYVGGSRTNSVLELAVGYNGLDRLLGGLLGGGTLQLAPYQGPMPPGVQPMPGPGGGGPQPYGPGGAPPPIAGPGGELGAPGMLRLFGPQLAGQVSWLLPMALVGCVAGVLRHRLAIPATPEQQQFVLWATWLLGAGGVFSFASFWHPYYLVVLAPAVAALAGIGVVSMWRDYRERAAGVRGWLLPLSLLATAALQASFLAAWPEWARWLGPIVVVGSATAALALVGARAAGAGARRAAPAGLVAASVGLAALLAAPAAWSVVTVANAPGEFLPIAGPSLSPLGGSGTGAGGGVPVGPAGPGGDPGASVDRALLAYLLEHRGDARFLFATGSSATASPYIIETGLPVMAMGGFGGADPILTALDVAELVADGEVRFFLLDGMDAPVAPAQRRDAQPPGAQPPAAQPPAGFPGDEVGEWVRENCRVVAPAAWRGESAAQTERPGGAGGAGGAVGRGGGDVPAPTLFDCEGAAA